ncbi:Zinc import ATP-binding protein ZnuC [Cellulomonas sp. T2.31MG-18]|uniref:metal ABC transporter ATP-binding protein n=1 Tax=Cellulomonas sp. T2.31MG-18 TaxID=3157619 RepID=UPI0035E4C8FD
MSAPLELRGAGLAFGGRTLWSGLDLTVEPGELVTVLGPNGAGKTTLLRVALGLQPLTFGEALVDGRALRRGSRSVGYVPQQRRIDPAVPVRARDLVRMGLDGDRWGPGWGRRHRREVDELLAAVGASDYADAPVGLLSGGEQQRVRIAQALATHPRLLLCDEPLLSLDPGRQQEMVALIDRVRRTTDAAVVLVTHEVNPVLRYTDRLLYLTPSGHAAGTPDQVLTTRRLSALYGTRVEVLRSGDRLLIVGGESGVHHLDERDDETQDGMIA